MSKITTRIMGTAAAAATAGTLLFAAPATAAPVTTAAAPTGATAEVKAGERDTKVSRSMSGIRSSAYVGKYFNKRYEGTRRCIVRKESGGNYRIQSRSGTYKGAYQFNSGLARSTALKMGRRDLAGKPINTWSRFDQDKAFWMVWNHGKGRGHWPTARGC